MNLCQYVNILGEPKKGFHKQRFLGVAIWDVLKTLMVAGIISIFSVNPVKKFIQSTIVLLLLGIFLHWWFCVPTALNQFLGL